MPRDDLVEVNGTILAALGGGQYEIQTAADKDGQRSTIRAQLCGKMKQNHIRVLPGDAVIVGVSPYDMTHGIITRRFK